MKSRAWVGLITGVLILLSALAHSFVGWPAFDAAFAATDLDADTVHNARISWLWGSVAMLVFAGIVLHTAALMLKGQSIALTACRYIAAGYMVFGVAAYIESGFASQFLLFVLTGLLVGWFAYPTPGSVN